MITPISLVDDVFTQVRNYLALTEESFSHMCANSSTENQFTHILEYRLEKNDDILNTYGIKKEHQHGGCEGDGEEFWYIFSIMDNGNKRYFKLPCCYNSYDDSSYFWDNVHEVKPVQRLTTYYEKL